MTIDLPHSEQSFSCIHQNGHLANDTHIRFRQMAAHDVKNSEAIILNYTY